LTTAEREQPFGQSGGALENRLDAGD
jgi:hypothetical protein